MRGEGSFSRGAINLDCFVFPEDRNVDVKVKPARLAYARAVDSQRERNRLTALLLKHSDDVCVEELGQLTANEATVNASLNILATAATTTANIVTGAQAQEILTGVGTFATASRSHLNSNVYRNTVAYAISRAITIERKRLRDSLEAHYGDSENQFTVDEAIRAANEYHGVCSFYKGLELVLASVEGDQRSREAQAREAQIDELEEQIRSYQEQMRASDGQDALYLEKIKELLDRIQKLRLAGVPLPDRSEDATNETETDAETETETGNETETEPAGDPGTGTDPAAEPEAETEQPEEESD